MDERARIICGDCLDVMREMEAASVDAIVTDPPYGLEFMGKGWDAPWKSGAGIGEHNAGFNAIEMADGAKRLPRPNYLGGTNPTCRTCGGTRNGNDRKSRRKCTCKKPDFPNTIGPRMRAYQAWATEWAAEALRVAKPGAHLLAFGGTRTYHRLTCAIEDAGWEIRDTIMYIFGSGFPKSLDVSKAIDRAAGAEREIVGRKSDPRYLSPATATSGAPLGNIAPRPNAVENYKKAGFVTAPATDAARQWSGWGTALKPAFEPVILARAPLAGTVAATVCAYGTGALNIDGCRIGTDESTQRPCGPDSAHARQFAGHRGGIRGQPSGTGRWPANLIHDGSAEVLALFPANRPGATSNSHGSSAGQNCYGHYAPTATLPGYADTGSAARFFYCSKASRKERGEGNSHPTVKPLALMRYLCRLVTPPGGLVLDPFAGSGTTLIAAEQEGFRAIGIEKDPAYVAMAERRIASLATVRPLSAFLDPIDAGEEA